MKKNILSVNQQKTLSLFDSNNHIRTNDVVKNLIIPRPTAKQILQKLKDIGLIEQKGRGRAAYYSLTQETEILDPQGNQLISVYKGVESFQGLFDRLARQLKRNDPYWAFAFKNEYHNQSARELLNHFHKILTQNGVDDRVLASNDAESIIKESFLNVPELNLRFTNLDIPIGLIILNDMVIHLIWGDQPLAIAMRIPEIIKRYRNFFLSTWDQAQKTIPQDAILKPGNTPIVAIHNTFGVKTLWMKDETKNPTHTFKDRLAYEMIRPLYEQYLSGKNTPSTTFGSISYGNTARSMGEYIKTLNTTLGSEVAHAVTFVPPSLTKKIFGPDTHDIKISAKKVLLDIQKTCSIVPIDLSKKIYRENDLKKLAEKHKVVHGEFIDITEGLNRPAYVNIIIEAIEQQLKYTPDYVIVPFGAGILCNEIIDYINEHHLHTQVIPVSSGNPDTIAVMLYGPIWVDVESLQKNKWGWTRHEDIDKKGHARKPYKVYHVSDEEIYQTMDVLKKKNIDAEPSSVAGFAFIPRLKETHPEFNPKKHSVLVINTGDSLLNYL